MALKESYLISLNLMLNLVIFEQKNVSFKFHKLTIKILHLNKIDSLSMHSSLIVTLNKFIITLIIKKQVIFNLEGIMIGAEQQVQA